MNNKELFRERFNLLVVDFREIFSTLPILLFHLALIGVWRLFDRTTLLFLQILVCSCITYFLVIAFSNCALLNSLSANRLLVLVLTFTLSTTLLLNVDRSRSVYVLKAVDQSVEIINSVSGTPKQSSNKLVEDSDVDAFQIRLDEQVELGTLKKKSTSYELTWLGFSLVRLFDVSAQLFSLRGYKDVFWQGFASQ